MDNIKELIEIIKPISAVFKTLLHPQAAIKSAWITILDVSYYVALIGGTVSIIMYVSGHKKAIKYAFSLPVLYALLQYLSN